MYLLICTLALQYILILSAQPHRLQPSERGSSTAHRNEASSLDSEPTEDEESRALGALRHPGKGMNYPLKQVLNSENDSFQVI